jgi:uncharacterized phiE125 gp8 family phage protein
MTLIQTTPPALEPVSLAEAKAHLRLDTTADDLLVAGLITAARQHIEKSMQIALISQSLSLFLDAWPALQNPIALPKAPILQLLAVRTFARDDTPTSLRLSEFEVDRGPPPRIAMRSSATPSSALRRLNAIEIAFTAGFGTSPNDVPQPIRHALLHLMAHLYEHRGLPSADAAAPVTEALLTPWRRSRLI